MTRMIGPATAFAALAILGFERAPGFPCPDGRRQAEFRWHLERPDRHRKGLLRPRLSLSGQDREWFGRLCGFRLVQRLRQVGDNGSVTVTVSRGSQSAKGTGRMSASDGTGTWIAGSGECSGTWTAERRS
jgi:hypothetical protein